MLQDILALNVFGFLLIFSRIGVAMSLLPGFSTNYVNIRVRLLFALAISFVLAPVLASRLPGLPETPMGLGLLVLGEIVVGAFLGSVARIILTALQVAGTIISLVSSLANALIQDPIVNQQTSTISGFLSTLGVTLIFVTNMHHMMLRAVFDSYTLFLPGNALSIGDMALVVARHVSDSFSLGLQLASPLVVTGFSYYLGLGLLTRLMPQMPVFFVGMPIQIVAQLSVLLLTVSGMMLVFLSHFGDGVGAFLAP